MDLHPSDTEEAVRAASEEYLRDNIPLGAARDRPDAIWTDMAAMGWFGIALPEQAGGVGMSLGAEALVLAELGRTLAPVGTIAMVVAAGIAVAAGDHALTGDILAGKRRVALGLAEAGGMLRVIEARGADLVLTTANDGAALFDAPADWTVRPCLDPSTSQAIILRPEKPRLQIAGSHAADHQRLATAAFALGCAEAARDMAAAYAKVREQFGRAIGSFQGVKHLCADMAVRCSAARAQLLYAALALEGGHDDAALQIAVAKRLADAAAVGNGRANIQVHGGMGMTDDCDAHLVLKRAHLLQFVSPVSTAMLLAA
jgi:alkylation response protein AidB-like acyl-CoA dehydrogenase